MIRLQYYHEILHVGKKNQNHQKCSPECEIYDTTKIEG